MQCRYKYPVSRSGISSIESALYHVKLHDLPLSSVSIIEQPFIEVWHFVQDLQEIPVRYLPFLDLLIFWDLLIFFVNISKGGARTNKVHPRVPNILQSDTR